MKTKLLITLTAVLLFLMPNANFGQTINLGSTANFVLFSTSGALGNTGISQLTGNVGTNVGSSTGFGNVNGIMLNNNSVTAQAALDLLSAYSLIKATVSTATHAPLLGDGETLVAGVYAIAGISTLSQTLTLDGKNDPNAVFIFQLTSTLSTGVNSKVVLINGAKACNVYWITEGLVSMASGTSMKGTVIANNAAIAINSGVTLEGRALAITGAVNVTNVLAYTPIGCSSPFLTGPIAPALASTENFALFTSNGSLINSGISTVKGDVGTNVGLTTGFDALKVTGAIHPIPDGATAACAADLINVYNYLNTLTNDIELLYPAQFGHNLVLTPHTYILNGSTALTDTLYLNGLGNANAIFAIKVKGALSTSVNSKVLLINGTQAKNVFWNVDGSVSINNNSLFMGTLICNNGAISINNGASLYGRALTTSGSFTTAAINVFNPGDVVNGIGSVNADKSNDMLIISPNPFRSYTTITLNDASKGINYKLKIYNTLGREVLNSTITNQTTTLKTSDLSSGIYFYKVLDNNQLIQSGKLISQQ